jgi:Arc/MetJ family transcription regulator
MAKIQHPGTKDDIIKSSGRLDPATKKGFIAIDDEAIVTAINAIASGSTDTETEILNENLVANTELEIDCGIQVKYVLVRSRNGKKLKLAYGATLTASEYITLERGTVYTDEAFYSALKIYLLSEAAETVEIIIKRTV